MDEITLELPTHIATLEDNYKVAMADVNNYKLGSKAFYEAIKYAQDIKRQINTNKMVARLYGVNYGVQAKAMGASI